MGEQQRKYTRGRLLARILIFALLAGILPYSGTSVSKAAETSASAKEKSAHELNNPSTTSDGVTTWDCVWFGNYWQNDTNGDGTADKNDEKDPIKWRVLSVNDDDAFLLADTNLDVQKYNDIWTSVTWEACTMRMWLNSVFLNNAFNASEQAAIQNTAVVNEDNPYYGTEGGEDTVDKVYLLSFSEVMNPSYGFTPRTDSTDTRKAVNTAYVAAGGEIKSSDMNSAGGTNMWWLRSPGYNSTLASRVNTDGYVARVSDGVFFNNIAVRPALHLNLRASSDALSALSWSYAGTVASGEKSLKLSGIKCRRGSKMISGKVSVSKATVKIKIGKKAWKKAKVKGKKFTLKLSSGLKKETKIMIKVTKKGYKSLVKTNKVK